MKCGLISEENASNTANSIYSNIYLIFKCLVAALIPTNEIGKW